MMINYKEKQKQNIKELVDILQDSLNYKVDNDREGLAQMLANQAIALDTMFQRLLVDSNSESIWNDEIRYGFHETKCENALKTQQQCRQTVSTLQHFIKQEEQAENHTKELKDY